MLEVASTLAAKLIRNRPHVERLRSQGSMDGNEPLQELDAETSFPLTLIYFRKSNEWIGPFHQPKLPRIVIEIIRNSQLEITWNTTRPECVLKPFRECWKAIVTLNNIGVNKAIPRQTEVKELVIGSIPVPSNSELPRGSKIRNTPSPRFLGLREDHFWAGTVFGPPQLTRLSRV